VDTRLRRRRRQLDENNSTNRRQLQGQSYIGDRICLCGVHAPVVGPTVEMFHREYDLFVTKQVQVGHYAQFVVYPMSRKSKQGHVPSQIQHNCNQRFCWTYLPTVIS